MLATPDELPTDEAQWAYEMKWDGVRAIVYAEGGPLRVVTRNDRDVASHYPELADLADAVDQSVVLDGEIVAADSKGRPSFGRLQQRMHVQHPSRELLADVPVTYLAFDVLRIDGHDTTGLSWEERRELLDSLDLDGEHWTTPPVFVGAGNAAVELSLAQDLEGVMAKRRSSTYSPGRRTRDWVKYKHVRTQEVVVGGWTEGEGRRHGGFGSLLVGVHDPKTGDLRYAGHVGTGFSDKVLDDLMRRLRSAPRQTSPFTNEVPRQHARVAHWVSPRLVGEVAFSEWTGDGILRHPRWRGLRPDKAADEVVPES
jgi:bifunctional non-homologous end joining protein LigD